MACLIITTRSCNNMMYECDIFMFYVHNQCRRTVFFKAYKP